MPGVMTDNVIDAAERFSDAGERQKTTVLDVLRRTKRVPLSDRPIIAARLGLIAVKLEAERPHKAVKSWFEHAWQGDRWAKRKRMVILPGETLPNADNEGAYVASGGDWAALIERASFAQHPGNGPTAISDRLRAVRDVLRGTTFLPAIATLHVAGNDAPALIASYAAGVATMLDRRSEIRRLWSVLATSPFGMTVSHLEADQKADDALTRASFLADEIRSTSEHGLAMGWKDRFVPAAPGSSIGWADPTVTLGLRAHRREARMFVVPEGFMDDLPASTDDEDPAPDERVIEWLIAKRLMNGKDWEDLPEIQYDEGKGYGWRPFPYELIQFVLLQVRQKDDGSPGLWATAFTDDIEHYHPVISGYDLVAAELGKGLATSFIGMDIYRKPFSSTYKFVEWPTWNERYMPGGSMPRGAASGLIDPEGEEEPEVSGWLDDTDNQEVQDLLFNTTDGIRFVPEVRIDKSVPTPCAVGSVAASIFANLSVADEDRIGDRLLAKAKRFAVAGLTYHQAVLDHHRDLIASMATENDD